MGYPVGIHFLISQIIVTSCILVLVMGMGKPFHAYFEYAVLMTGLTGLIAMIPSWYFYRRDRVRRIAGGIVSRQAGVRLSLGQGVLLFAVGAGLAQYGNILVGLIQTFFKFTVYQENMAMITADKSFLMLVFWMGIVAPVAEEVVFRWLVYLRLRDYMSVTGAMVISGLIFGIYHGNIQQAIYASLLGAVFAYILEISGNLWSCVILHIGANVWSLFLSEFGSKLVEKEYGIQILLLVNMILLAVLISGIAYYAKKGKQRERRII